MSTLVSRIAATTAATVIMASVPMMATADETGPDAVSEAERMVAVAPITVVVPATAALPVVIERASFTAAPVASHVSELDAPQPETHDLSHQATASNIVEDVSVDDEEFFIPVKEIVQVPGGSAEKASVRKAVVQAAKEGLGTPYVWGGNTAAGWDCSGFVKWAYSKAGIKTQRTTSSILASGQFVRTSQPQPGDLVFQRGGNHVGIYLGGGKMIGAQNPKTGTIIVKVSTNPLYGYYTLVN